MSTDQSTQPATDAAAGAEPPDNTVNWWEIQVPDLEAGKAFYGAVFGWPFTDFGDDFAICHGADGSMIGGLTQVEGEPAGRHVRIYVHTADLEAALDRVVANGGTVAQPRTLITEEFGWYANAVDPAGLTIGLSTSRPPTEPV
jgi:predicted enzyme related to lactoylglutathione lyase